METPASPPMGPSVRLRSAGLLTLGLVAAGLLIALAATRLAMRPAKTDDEGHWPEVARGKRFLRAGRPDLALEAVSAVRDERPGAGEAMYVAGMALSQMHHFRSARLAFERSLKLQPDRPSVLKALAALYLSMGESVRGLECLKRAAEVEPRDFRPWLAMGKVYLDLGRTSDAADAYAEAVKREPTHFDARLGWLESLLAVNRAGEAGPLAEGLLRLRPELPKLLGLAALQARDTGRDDRALDLAGRALALDPDEPEALLVRARLRLLAGRPEEALPDAERVVALNPNRLEALVLLGQVETRLGLTDRAAATALRHHKATQRLVQMDALTKEIDAHPDDPEPRLKLGLVALEGGQVSLARSCFQAALAVRPDYGPARERLDALDGAPSRDPVPLTPATASAGGRD
jgi:tetratricopeptide (TPR) repeat protein